MEQTNKTAGSPLVSTTVGDIALKKARGGKKASLPEVLELDNVEESDKMDVTLWLEQGLALKAQIGVAPDEKKNVVGSGLLKKMHDLKEKLGGVASSNGLEGLRHGRIVYTQRLQDGRETFNAQLFFQELLLRGVKAEVIQECAGLATGRGESYWVREISESKP